jgi:hypothetical protein
MKKGSKSEAGRIVNLGSILGSLTLQSEADSIALDITKATDRSAAAKYIESHYGRWTSWSTTLA